MLSDVKYLAKDGVLISYKIDGKQDQILFSDIEPYWDYSSEEDFESGTVYISEDCLVFTIIVAQGQGGIIAVWNVNSHRITHISEGSACVALTVYKGQIISLCEVAAYAMPMHYAVYTTEIGSMDAWSEGTQLYCQKPVRVRANRRCFSLQIEQRRLLATIGDATYEYTDNIEAESCRRPAVGYESLYGIECAAQDDALHGLNEKFKLLEGMLI